jgi:hypothetical protein
MLSFRCRLGLIVSLLSLLVLGDASVANAASYTFRNISTNTDYYLTITNAETLVISTVASVGDSTLWLFNSAGTQVAYNDDYSGLNSYIIYMANFFIYF